MVSKPWQYKRRKVFTLHLGTQMWKIPDSLSLSSLWSISASSNISGFKMFNNNNTTPPSVLWLFFTHYTFSPISTFNVCLFFHFWVFLEDSILLDLAFLSNPSVYCSKLMYLFIWLDLHLPFYCLFSICFLLHSPHCLLLSFVLPIDFLTKF